ncbi:MAG TPA: MFS transporter [Caulobacteraceae bacterium]
MSATPVQPPRAPVGTLLIFALGGLPTSALGAAMAIAVQPHMARDLGVSLTTVAAAFSIVRLLDLWVDPVMALVMDRTRTPLGRYRAWLVGGAPILMLGVYQLFMAKKGIGLPFLIVWLFVYALGSSITVLSRQAWSATLVTRYGQRSLFYGLMASLGVIGTLVALATPVVLAKLGHGQSGASDVPTMGWIILGMIPVCVLLVSLLVPERVAIDAPTERVGLRDYWQIVKRPELLRLFVSSFSLTLGPGWMSNLYLFFFIAARGFTNAQAYLLLLVYVVSGVIGAPLIGWAGARFSKHRTMIAATIGYSIGLCTVLLPPRGDVIATLPLMMWCGFMATGFELTTSAMMADLGDQVRLEQGKERMALLFATTGLSAKLASAGAVAMSYWLLSKIGFVATTGAHNSPAVLSAFNVVFLSGPIFFVTLGGLCFLGWKLDAGRHALIRAQLEARDAMLDNPALGELSPLN